MKIAPQESDPLKKADFFSVIFDQTPTYAEIVSVTKDGTELTGVNELFKLKIDSVSSMAPLTHFVSNTC